MNKICKVCGLIEEYHHEFEPREMPDGCVCDPLTWDVDVVKPACNKYVGNGTCYCSVCGHDEECHK